MTIRAIVFGATGMVGEGVLHESLGHPDIESVLVIGRRSCGITHPKLTEILLSDFFDYSPILSRLRGYNACFFCLGVSSVGMKREEYQRVTYDLTMSAARALAELNADMTFCYVSGAGTDSSEQGRLTWARVKGKTENELLKLPFKAAYMFRPGYIKPTRGLKHSYPGAAMIGAVYPVLLRLLPKYVCTLEELGRAMIHVSQSGNISRVLENRDIRQRSSI